jgi:hypothetical protein
MRGIPRVLVPNATPKHGSFASTLLHGRDTFRAKELYQSLMVCEPMHLCNGSLGFAKPTSYNIPGLTDVARSFLMGDAAALQGVSDDVLRALRREGWTLKEDGKPFSLELMRVEPEQTEEEFLAGTEQAFSIVCASLAKYGVGLGDNDSYLDQEGPSCGTDISRKKKHTHRLLPSQAGLLPRVLAPPLFESATADDSKSRIPVGDMVPGMGFDEEIQYMRIPGTVVML